jgi:hypothetical protein
MKVVVAGSRSITNRAEVYRAIELSGWTITEVVCGTAAGVDTLGEEWAISKGIPVKKMPANWFLYGNKAGPIRNQKMAEYADAAVVVWDGQSKGALNMIKNMIRLNKPYFMRLYDAASSK